MAHDPRSSCQQLSYCFLHPGGLMLDEDGFRQIYKWLRDPKSDLSTDEKISLYLNLFFDIADNEEIDATVRTSIQHLLVAKIRLLPNFKCQLVRDLVPATDYKIFAMRGAIPEALLQTLGISAFFIENYPGKSVVGTFSARRMQLALQSLTEEPEHKYHEMNQTIERYLLRMKSGGEARSQ